MATGFDERLERTQIRRIQESARRRQTTRDEQDIGSIPPVSNPDRRSQAEESFHFFCRTYFPAAFTLPWSEYHHKAAEKIEIAVSKGGLFAFAMPRGSGKTTMCEWAVLWATLTGKSLFTLLVGATQRSSDRRLSNIRTEFQTNQLLLEDFPEACYPIERLEREPRRCAGQKHHGRPTAITWTKNQLILPSVWLEPGEACNTGDEEMFSPTSGAIINVAAITGEVRGLNHKREDGSIVRPEFAICDDPQTRESAKSVQQSDDRYATIAGDVAYGSAPDGKAISVVVPCTVIYEGDMADRLLSDRYWKGERTRMVEAFPDGLMEGEMQTDTCKLWSEYKQIRETEFENGGDGSVSTQFYAENQKVMDSGFDVSWPERFKDGELSAIQHAMNCYYVDPASFFAEYQNEPVNSSETQPELSNEDIAGKMTAHARGVIPQACDTVTAFIDVGKDVLFWVVVAWEPGFGGHVLDYGAFPGQGTRNIDTKKLARTLSHEFPGHGFEGTLYAGLDKLTDIVCSKKWTREDGVEMQVSRCGIDANWGQSTPVVYRLCSASKHARVLTPAHGKFYGATSQPIGEASRKRGEKIGHHWRLGPSQTNAAIRRLLVDVNYWKSFVYDRLATGIGDRGSLTFFQLPESHSLFARHVNAESRTQVQNKTSGRIVDEWKMRPNNHDNHWWDCLVGAAAVASLEGVSLENIQAQGTSRQAARRYTGAKKLSEIRRQKRR